MNWYRSAKLQDRSAFVRIASVSAYVSGFKYPPRRETVLDICYQMHGVMEKFQTILSQEEYKYWSENGVRSEFFAPDGDDFDKSYGIMNVYVRAFPSNKIAWLVSEIKTELNNIDVNIEGIKYENYISGDQDKNSNNWSGIRVIRFEMASNPNSLTYKDVPPDLNMTGSNASLVASLILGKRVSTDDGVTLDAQIILDNINSKLNTYMQKWDEVVESKLVSEQYQEGVVNYLETRMPILKQIAQWAVDHGYKEIYFA